jgi:hypothetical protein
VVVERIVAMLINIHLQFFVDGVFRQLIMVCETHYVVIKGLVDVVYAVGTKFALIKYALYARMGVYVRTLPAACGVDVAIWVIDVGASKWARLRKVVYWAKACGNSKADGNEYYHHQ